MNLLSVPMALAAYIPVALFAAGTINIAAAGALQTRRWRSACPRGVNWNEA